MLSDIDICKKTTLQPIDTIADRFGLTPDEYTSFGATKAKVSLSAIERLKDNKDGKLVLVTAITPTPLGEGKTVTSIGLAQGLSKIGKKVAACIRQPSMGPIFGVKGGAAGGGYSQVAPMEELNLHLSGDIHAVTSAHNLAAAAIDARIYHEQKAGYEAFEHKTGLKALRLDANNILWKRVVDINDRALRMVTIGKNKAHKQINGYEREDGFDISAASELMAILALSKDLADLRRRIGKIVVGYNLDGNPVTTEDLEVAGAMAVTMRETITPTLMQTLEGVPTLIHSGPFANIAHGNSSIIADNIALKLTDYTVTEAGFGSDMGFEKACNIKASVAEKAPDCAVIVATLRGIKANAENSSLSDDLFTTNFEALKQGYSNLNWHIRNVKQYGIPVVVAINRFEQDSDTELDMLRKWIHSQHEHVSVAICDAYSQGGEGAIELAHKVVDACQNTPSFKPLYQPQDSLEEKLMTLSEIGYGAKNVLLSDKAKKQLKLYQKLGYNNFNICMAKTPMSISSDPSAKGAPSEFDLPISEIRLCAGAGFVYALSGNVMTMPGLPEKPAFMKLDIDESGEITGLS